MDIGIKLSDKKGEDFDLYEVVDEVNKAVSKYGLRTQQFSSWTNFTKSCAHKYKFIKDLYEKYGLKEEED